MNDATLEIVKEFSVELIKQIDMADCYLVEIVKKIFDLQMTIFTTNNKSLDKDTMVKMALFEVPDEIAKNIIDFAVAIIRAIGLMCTIKVISNSDALDAHCKFIFSFVTRLKAINYPYFVAHEKELNRIEEEMKTLYDSTGMTEKKTGTKH